MCGIIGLFGVKDVEEKLKQGLSAMKGRGQDAQKVVAVKGGGLGHNLHSLVGYVEQPLNDRFVFNGEIYNWKELQAQYKVEGENDAEVFLALLEKKGREALQVVDGVYALAWITDDKVILSRDILGVKPLWYSKEQGFAFASEKKALLALGYELVEELNPRQLLTYDIEKDEVMLETIKEIRCEAPLENKEEIKKALKGLLADAVGKRIPDQKLGVLFSGGIDSTLLAFMLKQLDVPFHCYVAGIAEEGMEEAPDVLWAKKVAKELDFPLTICSIGVDEVEEYVKEIVPLIEDSNVVKVGVALPFFLCCEEAKKDGIKVMMSGLGSEELFAGYERHAHSSDVNKECVQGLQHMYQRDLYRDDVVSMYHSIELRLPFLDHRLLHYALRIPGTLKIDDERKKIILREVAEELGIPKEFAWRKKQAAQYGSKFDRALDKLARKQGVSKSAYTNQFAKHKNLRLGVLFSSGKDSTYALHIMHNLGYEISCLITLESKNPDSYMFHTPAINMAGLQAEAMDLPLLTQTTKGEKEEELADLRAALEQAKKEHQIEGIVTGAVFSTYQRNRVEKICDELGLKVFSPLWHKPQALLLQEVVEQGYKIMFTAVRAEGLGEAWLGKVLTAEDVAQLVQLEQEKGVHAAGEGGEFESLVLDAPLFKKTLVIDEQEKQMENEHTGVLVIDKAHLEEKHG